MVGKATHQEMPEQNHCIGTEAAITPAAAQQFERAVAA
jgi:hypothetical protein